MFGWKVRPHSYFPVKLKFEMSIVLERDYCRISQLKKMEESFLSTDVFLIIIYANRIPPHLAVSVSGNLFTLTVKGATVNSSVVPLFQLIRSKKIESIFVKLSIPPLFTLDDLNEQIKKYTLAYPRVDIGIATCLAPIKDFCNRIYDTPIEKVNYVYDLLDMLDAQGKLQDCYHLNLEQYLKDDQFMLRKYSMSDIYEGIRGANSVMVV